VKSGIGREDRASHSQEILYGRELSEPAVLRRVCDMKVVERGIPKEFARIRA
jgi:hypothetical protein